MKLTTEQQKIVEDNEKLIYWFMHRHNLKVEDYYDILAIGLCKAAYNYKDNASKFSTYATAIMQNEVRMHIRNNSNKSKIPEGITISLNAPIGDFEMQDMLYGMRDVWDELILLDNINFTNMEKEILNLCVIGYTQRQIAERLNVGQPYICRKIKTIRNKIEGVLLNEA